MITLLSKQTRRHLVKVVTDNWGKYIICNQTEENKGRAIKRYPRTYAANPGGFFAPYGRKEAPITPKITPVVVIELKSKLEPVG